jgi:hypothetical protein
LHKKGGSHQHWVRTVGELYADEPDVVAGTVYDLVIEIARGWPSMSCGSAPAGGVPKWTDAASVSDSM